MEDRDIVELYRQRSENAILESEIKYGRYCRSIACGICGNREDSEECVSDTWLKAWNSIPPESPETLKGFFGCICRNISLDLWRRKRAGKRGGGETELALEELAGCIPDSGSPEKELEARELERALRDFVHRLPRDERRTFLARYYFLLPVKEIARRQKQGISKTKMSLSRSREKLMKELRKEGLL